MADITKFLYFDVRFYTVLLGANLFSSFMVGNLRFFLLLQELAFAV